MPLFENYEKLEKLLNSGILYGFQRDNQNRPLVFYSARRAIDLGATDAQIIDLVNFLASYSIEFAMVPGKVETYNFIIDFADVSVMEFQYNLMRSLVATMKENYKLRIHGMIITNVDWRI